MFKGLKNFQKIWVVLAFIRYLVKPLILISCIRLLEQAAWQDLLLYEKGLFTYFKQDDFMNIYWLLLSITIVLQLLVLFVFYHCAIRNTGVKLLFSSLLLTVVQIFSFLQNFFSLQNISSLQVFYNHNAIHSYLLLENIFWVVCSIYLISYNMGENALREKSAKIAIVEQYQQALAILKRCNSIEEIDTKFHAFVDDNPSLHMMLKDDFMLIRKQLL